MKKILLSVFSLIAGIGAMAQFGTAPDFSVVDLDGNEHNLYADILDQGLVAVIDVSATWCPPCWSLHSSHALEDLHQAYGPNGTNQLRVIFYEGDASTTLADLEGTTGGTMGDWLDGTTYPVINESPLSLDLGIWAPLGFPTVNIVRPSDYEIVADTWNVLTFEGQVDAINNSGAGIVLDPVSVNEVEATALVAAFPNPTAGDLTIQLGGFDGQVMIEVYDMIGNIAFQTSTANSIERMDLSELAAGNYMLRAYSDKQDAVQRISIVK